MSDDARDRSWWRSAVVYQIYPRSFADSDGDGVGDLGGVLQRLDHLEHLGVDVVWLSPVYRSPQADNGYDISDYTDIDPLFGTLEQLDELVAGLHARGIRLLMDLVVNHTSDEHPWFVDSRSSRHSPRRDWYVWRDARPGTTPGEPGSEPNNWGSFFSGSAWQWDEQTGQYYLHLFDRKQPDLNWENPEVRAAVHAMMRWWLDRGVDGFRMDVINFISKTAGLPDAPAVPGRPYANAFELFADGPRIHEFLAEMTREVFAGRSGAYLTVGEMPGVTPEQARLYTDPERDEVDMVFQFEHVSLDTDPLDKFAWRGLELVDLKHSLHRWQDALAERGWNSLYWNNHDQPRAVSRFGDDDPRWWAASAKALATVLHGLRGTPYVYQGEEIGMTNFPFTSADQHRDVEAVNYYATVVQQGLDEREALTGLARVGRDNARTPVQWDATAHAGFTTGRPWLAVNPNASWLNVAAQRDDPHSVLAHYRTLIRLRHEVAVLVEGRTTLLLPHDPQLWCYTRDDGRSRLLVVANLGREPREVPLDPSWSGAQLLLGNLTGTPAVLDAADLTLAGWDARMYLTRS
ncbi:alpha,alpha-phosphotrehalase [Auraticoccus sp. F435]|uniref:Alpha,alpha-phosphotrehalase n=1 Tax=Auraticoccus cholistanensis TaxID=2656650 RepID=A0A6A9UWU0_9ACTN|nr:alpha-glucosidase [Auraticoccus cholistanensis]MVA77313.1 alpha,alpha-phosphotrehalase [Auraticoccus cholistanensis]